MAYIKKAFGPPGTGKTTWIVEQTAELVRRGEVNPYNIASTSLTKATKEALLHKLDNKGVKIKSENIRTLHSWAYQSLKTDTYTPYVLKHTEIAEFFKSKGFEFKTEDGGSEDDEFIQAEYHETEGNRLYQAFNKLRLTWDGSNPTEHIYRFYERERDEMPISAKSFFSLFKDFVKWLQNEGVYDYTRLLTEAYKNRATISGDLLILDEYQDKGNLHNLIVKEWLKHFKYALVCGDDDQAIFTFAGSDPKHLIELEADETYILPMSYRLPSKIHDFAMRIIKENRYRVPKEFKPYKEGGRVEWLFSFDDVLVELNGKQTFILARNKYFVQEWGQILEMEDIPYRVIGRKQLIPDLAKHIRTHLRLLGGEAVDDESLTKLITALKPLIRSLTGKKQIRESVVASIREKIKKRDFSGEEGKVVYLVLSREPERLFVDHDEIVVKRWKKRARNLERWQNPNISIGTIHSAKGLEADTVFLDTRITKKVLESGIKDQEAGRRVLYVGITRAREELYLVQPGGAYTYEHLELL